MYSDEEQLFLPLNAPKHLSARKISARTLKRAISMALSFTFTAGQFATARMAVSLPTEDEDAALAAAGLISTTTNILCSISISVLFSMSILASKKQGKLFAMPEFDQERRRKMNRNIADIYQSGLGLSTLILPLPFAGLFFSKYILTSVFQLDEKIAELVQQNLRAYSFALPAIMYRMCAEQMLFSFGKTVPAMLTGLVTFALGTGLAWYFAFGRPNLGLSGIAYGYLIEAWLTFAGFTLYIGNHATFKDLPFFKKTEWKALLKQLKKMLALGLPITLQMSAELFASLFVGVFSGWLGKDQLAAQNFSTQLFIFAIIPSIAFGQSIAQEVSRYLGKREFVNAMRFSRYGLLTSLGFVTTICLPFAVYPPWLTTILAPAGGERALKMSRLLILMAAIQVIYDTGNYGMTQTLRAANDPVIPTLTKTGCLGLGLLIAWGLGLHSYLDVYGVGIGFLIGVALAAMLIFPRWLQKTEAASLAGIKVLALNQSDIALAVEKYQPAFFKEVAFLTSSEQELTDIENRDSESAAQKFG